MQETPLDNTTPAVAPTLDPGAEPSAGPSPAPSPRELVVAFYEAALNEKNVAKARQYLGDTYIQHNPRVADGVEGLVRLIEFRRAHYPEARNEIKRVIAEGGLVALHVHSVVIPGSPGRAIVDIFRVADGKVVEHWDVIQEIPVEIFPPLNDNGLF
jgi:predicted SnoaL-like aldol condensation-catalyzing enzyme